MAVDGVAPMDAARTLDYISNRLEYLKTSRPTAVNLADAAGKLWNAVLAESKKTHPAEAGAGHTVAPLDADARAILSLYIGQAEAMLADDIADNKAIGSYGATFILDGSAAALVRGGDKVPQTDVAVLTHCNTGSLATAGWVSISIAGDALFCLFFGRSWRAYILCLFSGNSAWYRP